MADINPGSPGSYARNFTRFNQALYFSAYDRENGGALWKHDGTGVNLVADPEPSILGTIPGELTVFNNALYFYTAEEGSELWKYDGTSISFVAYPGGRSPLTELTVFDNALYFGAYDGVHGSELWKYDGNTISLVADINPGRRSSYPRGLTVFGNTLLLYSR